MDLAINARGLAYRPIGKESAVGKHTERLASTPHGRAGLARDEERLKSMIDHPAGRHCHGDEGELDLPFLNDGGGVSRGGFRWSGFSTGFACLLR